MRTLVIAGLALAACAAPRPVERLTQPWPTARQAAPQAGAPATAAADAPTARPESTAADTKRLLETNPTGWAKRFRKGAECEAAARAMKNNVDADTGWRAINACVAKGDFRAFARLTDGFWDADLRSRPDAPRLVAAVIATRGADLPTDLETLRKHKVPLFSLESASSHPNVYTGRSVAFIARVEGIEKGAKGTAVANLAELSMIGRNAGTTTEARYSESTRQDEHGRKYRVKENYLGTERKTNYQNELDDTGVEVRGILTKVDPFFEPGATFLVVARFEGMTGDEDSLDGQQPSVTVLAYYVIGAESFLD
jgi:hypothetical protein